MVSTISPNYYAAGEIKGDFTLTGQRFTMIPNNAIGILSGDNDDPGYYRNSNNPYWIGAVNIIDDSNMEVLQDSAYTHSSAVYLGMIVSEDRQTIYWVNNTKPLP